MVFVVTVSAAVVVFVSMVTGAGVNEKGVAWNARGKN